MRRGLFVGVGLTVALLLAIVVAPHASSKPDGLDKVADDNGFAETATPHALDDSPTHGLHTSVGGLVGVVVTFAFASGVFVLVRRRSSTG